MVPLYLVVIVDHYNPITKYTDISMKYYSIFGLLNHY